MEYLMTLAVVLAATAFLHWKFRPRLYGNTKHMMVTVVALFCVGTLWDYWAISRGHWSFSPERLVGVYFMTIPLEEYIFFFVVPYFILTVQKVMELAFVEAKDNVTTPAGDSIPLLGNARVAADRLSSVAQSALVGQPDAVLATEQLGQGGQRGDRRDETGRDAE